MDKRIFKLDDELDKMDKRISDTHTKLFNTIDMAELHKVWDQFQRFAEYKDLKKLHAIVIPEIAKFELKMINYQSNLDQHDLIIRNFDEVLQ